MDTLRHSDAYDLILLAIDDGVFQPGDRMVEHELAKIFGFSRTPIREALHKLETQSLLMRVGRSLVVASLDHTQLSDLYAVRTELESLAVALAAQHATKEEILLLQEMVDEDVSLINDTSALSKANKRFHKQLHLASHNKFLIQQLDLVHRSMVLMAKTSLAVPGRGPQAIREHQLIVNAISNRDSIKAREVLCDHLSVAFKSRLKEETII